MAIIWLFLSSKSMVHSKRGSHKLWICTGDASVLLPTGFIHLFCIDLSIICLINSDWLCVLENEWIHPGTSKLILLDHSINQQLGIESFGSYTSFVYVRTQLPDVGDGIFQLIHVNGMKCLLMPWWVFHYTWRALQTSFREVVNSWLMCPWWSNYTELCIRS